MTDNIQYLNSMEIIGMEIQVDMMHLYLMNVQNVQWVSYMRKRNKNESRVKN